MPTTSNLPGSDVSEQSLVEELRRRGHRVTSQRLVIHRALRELDRHATAEEVLAAVGDRLPNLSIPTVYATLDLLGRLGHVRRISPGEGPVLYDPRTEAHHHLVCVHCGRVDDLDAPVETGAALRAAKGRGFAADHAGLVVSGTCSRCAAIAGQGES